MKRIDRAIVFGLAVSAWAGIVLVLVPGRASVVGHVWLVLVLAIGVVAAVGALLRTLPMRRSAVDAPVAPRGRPRAPPLRAARPSTCTTASGRRSAPWRPVCSLGAESISTGPLSGRRRWSARSSGI